MELSPSQVGKMTSTGVDIFERGRARRIRMCGNFFAAHPRAGFCWLYVLLTTLPWGLLRGAQETQQSAARVDLPTAGSMSTLTHIQQIRGLTLEQAKRGYPVRIRAVVTYCHFADGDLFIQDSTAGVWVDPKRFNLNLRFGQLVEVEGTAGVGDFSPEIDKAQVRILGEAPLPVPRRVSGDELASGRQDSQWVEVEAVVRSAAERGTDLTLNASAGAYQFRVFAPGYGAPPADLVDSVVRVRGVFAGTYTPGGLFTGFQILVPSRSGIQVVRRPSGELLSLPVRPIHYFLRFTPEGAFTHRVRVQGVVTYQGSELLYIRDQDGALLIHLSMPMAKAPQNAASRLNAGMASVQVGDLVDVIGFPDRGEYTPVMRDAVFRKIGVGSLPQPTTLSVQKALQGDHDADLVRLSAYLLNRTGREGQEVLELQEGDITFRAEMEKPNGAESLGAFGPGSLLELTGIRQIEVNANRVPRAFSLLLRSPADVVVLKRPPWWTLRKGLVALAMLMSAVLAVLCWVAVLRRRVRSQTQLIRKRLESEAALEKRFQRLFERNLAGVCLTSLDGRLLDCNEAMATMSGYGSRKDLLGRQITGTLIAPAEREAFVTELKAEKRLSNRETRLQRKDGSTLWVIENATLVDDADGRSPIIESTCIDITEWKSTLEELRESEERYRELFENASDIVYTTDLESRITSLNRVGQQVLGYSREEATQLRLWDLVDPKHWDRVKQGRRQLLAGESDVNAEIEVRAKDGRRVILEVKPGVIYKDGKPVGLQGIGRDITGREAVEMELRHVQKLESVGRLAAGIAHEINTPIQFVGDNTRFLQESFESFQSLLSKYQELRSALASGAAGPEFLAEVQRVEEESDCAFLLEEVPRAITQTLEGVDRVATIVRAMKEFAHPESKQMAAHDLNRALLSTLTVARNELKYVANVETEFGELPMVVCNVGDLNQVFLNLLVNAAHAIGEVVKNTFDKGTIRVRTQAEGNTVLVTISDTGCGIPEANRNKVFDPFFTTKEVGRGTGQGLAISRSVVVDRHKGTLTFDSEVGKGTTFYVRLPIDPGECSKETRAA
jgi:PAS domain S-box-containing protein